MKIFVWISGALNFSGVQTNYEIPLLSCHSTITYINDYDSTVTYINGYDDFSFKTKRFKTILGSRQFQI